MREFIQNKEEILGEFPSLFFGNCIIKYIKAARIIGLDDIHNASNRHHGFTHIAIRFRNRCAWLNISTRHFER
ncbi:hypothetical protein C7S16_5249 [Burkholderia thailandensis]|uniref:Uncharacterized protein n=1 Tax=Burkholderia thailandensis TaxID=57975 RepID=A0AAW9CSB1_BURTH|nr:hypothetical protein [Burkholderia thailandensis]MDW9251968.1 hypothetical protein [Burkholderia thailandensis]